MLLTVCLSYIPNNVLLITLTSPSYYTKDMSTSANYKKKPKQQMQICSYGVLLVILVFDSD